MYVLDDTGGSSGGSDSEIFNEHIDATDAQRNTALANVSNQTADSTTGKMGYKVLDPTKTFAEQVTVENTIYEIRDVFDLGGNEFTIPSNVEFNFNGGAIKNGTLIGELHTTQPLKGRDIGLMYGQTVYTDGEINATRFTILSGLTNKVTINLEDDLYISSSANYNFVGNSISINGHGHILKNYGYTLCFSVNSDVEIINTDIQTTSSFMSLFSIINHDSTSNVTIKNCKFQGNLRILSSNKVANQEGTKFFENIIIDSCEFNNICCRSGNSSVFFLIDTNIKNLKVINNSVTNFFGIFINLGITNDSVYENYISSFTQKFGRNICVENNKVINDSTFKHWISYEGVVSTYFCFVLAEDGNCVYRNNHIENLVSNDSGIAVYDSYLSVDNLVYENNIWINNVNIASVTYNEFLKGKGGANGGTRVYINNKFKTTNIASTYEVESIKGIKIIDVQSSNKGILKIEGNEFDIFSLYGNQNFVNPIENIFIINNVFTIHSVTGAQYRYVIDVGASNFVNVCNNTVFFDINTEVGTYYLAPALIYSTSNGSIYVTNNTCKNCIPIEQTDDCKICVVENNTIDIAANILGCLMMNNIKNGLQYKNNFIKQLKVDANSSAYCRIPTSYSFICNNNSSIFLISGLPADGSIVKCVVKITNTQSGKYALFEYNSKYENNARTYKYLDKDTGIFSTGSELPFIANLGNENIGNFKRGVHYLGSMGNIPLLYEVSISTISNINDFNYIPTKGTTAQRPANVTIPTGFQYFDTDLGKYICWNSTDWVNLDGTTLS